MASGVSVVSVGSCAKLCYDPSEVDVVGLLYIWLTGIAQLTLAVCQLKTLQHHWKNKVIQASMAYERSLLRKDPVLSNICSKLNETHC